MKHTPGPWKLPANFLEFGGTQNDGGLAIVSEERRICVVDLVAYAPRGKAYKTACPERDANARLIAAAPDMVEALLDAIAVIEAHINMTGTYKRGIYGHLPSSCRDALRKIRGE